MIKSFDEVLKKVKSQEMKKVAVAVAQDEPVLQAIRDAKNQGIADAILVGDKEEIEKIEHFSKKKIEMELAREEAMEAQKRKEN